MTYSSSLQSRFVSGKHTPLILILLSVLLWGVVLFLLPVPHNFLWNGAGRFLSMAIPPVCYLIVAFMLGSIHLYERRISWFAPLYLLLTASAVRLHYDVEVAVSTLLFVFLMKMLLACQPNERAAGSLFSAFALLCLSSFFLPQCVFLLPLFVVYMSVVGLTGVRMWLSAALGFFMPFWFLAGTLYVWPEFAGYVPPLVTYVEELSIMDFAEIGTFRILYAVAELGIMLPAMALFAASSVPGKPHLRKRLLFVMLANAVLFALSWFSGSNYELLYAWRVPGVAIMLSYLFSSKVTRLSNVYFIVVLLYWLILMVLDVWLN